MPREGVVFGTDIRPRYLYWYESRALQASGELGGLTRLRGSHGLRFHSGTAECGRTTPDRVRTGPLRPRRLSRADEVIE